MTLMAADISFASPELGARRRLPLELHWTAAAGPRPVRLRAIRGLKSRSSQVTLSPLLDGGFHHANGQDGVPFDFTLHVRRLCSDIVSRCHELHHIDIDRLLFTIVQARSVRRHGLQARVTPMRFANGDRLRRRRGRLYEVQRYHVAGVEMLYLVSFCVPRFLELPFDDKLVTIFHELYHISPHFDGDLRRHNGRYSIHTHSKKGYDEHMKALAREYLSNGAEPSLHAFLRLNFRQLEARFGQVLGQVVPTPKLIFVGD